MLEDIIPSLDKETSNIRISIHQQLLTIKHSINHLLKHLLLMHKEGLEVGFVIKILVCFVKVSILMMNVINIRCLLNVSKDY